MSAGIACSRYACLSPIDAELSIAKRRSILLTASTEIAVVKFVFVVGSPGTTGRSRQAPEERERAKAEDKRRLSAADEECVHRRDRWPGEGGTVMASEPRNVD